MVVTNKGLGFLDANQAMRFLCEQSFPLTPRTTILLVIQILSEFFLMCILSVAENRIFSDSEEVFFSGFDVEEVRRLQENRGNTSERNCSANQNEEFLGS